MKEGAVHFVFTAARVDYSHPHETLFEETIHILQGDLVDEMHFLGHMAKEYVNSFIQILFMSDERLHFYKDPYLKLSPEEMKEIQQRIIVLL